jgi:hypothetical protein
VKQFKKDYKKEINKEYGRVRNSAIASQPCPSGHITADKRLWCFAPSPKLPSATSFICKPSAESRIFSKQAGGYKYEY